MSGMMRSSTERKTTKESRPALNALPFAATERVIPLWGMAASTLNRPVCYGLESKH